MIVGTDRMAANGDVANKIGTYAHRGPGASPRASRSTSRRRSRTVDLACARGEQIPIEERPPREVTHVSSGKGSRRAASRSPTRPSTSRRASWSRRSSPSAAWRARRSAGRWPGWCASGRRRVRASRRRRSGGAAARRAEARSDPETGAVTTLAGVAPAPDRERHRRAARAWRCGRRAPATSASRSTRERAWPRSSSEASDSRGGSSCAARARRAVTRSERRSRRRIEGAVLPSHGGERLG